MTSAVQAPHDHDPRGPERHIIAVDSSPTTHTAVTLSCGHVREFVAHHSYRVGERAHCRDCRTAVTPIVASLGECLQFVEREALRIQAEVSRMRPLEVISTRDLHAEGRALGRLHATIAQLAIDAARDRIGRTDVVSAVSRALASELRGAGWGHLKERVRGVLMRDQP